MIVISNIGSERMFYAKSLLQNGKFTQKFLNLFPFKHFERIDSKLKINQENNLQRLLINLWQLVFSYEPIIFASIDLSWLNKGS